MDPLAEQDPHMGQTVHDASRDAVIEYGFVLRDNRQIDPISHDDHPDDSYHYTIRHHTLPTVHNHYHVYDNDTVTVVDLQ